jgi:hypothetical protein
MSAALLAYRGPSKRVSPKTIIRVMREIQSERASSSRKGAPKKGS